jgi:hypothetical protein
MAGQGPSLGRHLSYIGYFLLPVQERFSSSTGLPEGGSTKSAFLDNRIFSGKTTLARAHPYCKTSRSAAIT